MELIELGLITSRLNYSLSYIPAGTLNQFRLNLLTDELLAYPRWTSIRALNALALNDSLFMDLIGDANQVPQLFGPTTYYLEINVKKAQGNDAQVLRVSLTISDNTNPMQPKKTEIDFTAPLIRN
jgi:hypothetical protein